jgi:hypothetical protein
LEDQHHKMRQRHDSDEQGKMLSVEEKAPVEQLA